MTDKVLVTGATGFVGRALCEQLVIKGISVRGTLLPSERPSALIPGVEGTTVEPLGPDTVWEGALDGVETVIHLAARVHIMADTSSDPLVDFRMVNVTGTKKLALDAIRAGIRRFVFVSSVKVNGEETFAPYTVRSPAEPVDPYGVSKWEAEQALRQMEKETGLEVVIVRPPLVYGPGVKANFLNLMKVVNRGMPLPLASVTNRRSFIFVRNLADALVCCASHSGAAGHTYFVGDGCAISTPELIRRLAGAMGVPQRLFPFPVSFLRLAGAVIGKSSAVDRLVGSLEVDGSAISNDLDWTAPYTMDDGLRETAEWFLEQAK